MTASEIYILNKKYAGNNLIVADSADPRMISSLSTQGLNIVPTIKGQGSVIFGISILQDYDLIVDPNGLELINEFNNYIWLEKKSQTPCHAYSHLMDALRYAVAYQLSNPNRGRYFVQ